MPGEMKDVPRRSPEQLAAIAQLFAADRVFSSAHMEPHEVENLLQLVFMPLALGALVGFDTSQIGIVYEELRHAMPRSINGLPCFMSCHLLHVDDWQIVRSALLEASIDQEAAIARLTAGVVERAKGNR